jgi:hypothetical protein
MRINHGTFRSFQGVLPGRYFDEIALGGIDQLTDISMFGNTQKITLSTCSSITDISSLRNVSYLVVMSCNGIKDYSCLGAQHYLEIRFADHLRDEDLNNFGKVHDLRIGNCSRITYINQLTDNLFIDIWSCFNLCEVVLPGFDYIYVKLGACRKLASVSIPGWVYSLNINRCSSTSREISLKNYNYLDFE